MPVITMRERETEEKSREEEGRDRNRWLYRRCYPSLGEEERCKLMPHIFSFRPELYKGEVWAV